MGNIMYTLRNEPKMRLITRNILGYYGESKGKIIAVFNYAP
jgi:hypothetical protein